jgi:hypothetical protein
MADILIDSTATFITGWSSPLRCWAALPMMCWQAVTAMTS